jgi:hypothetical protein
MGTSGGITITRRDKILLVVLPALFIVIVYGWAFTKAPIQRLKALDAQVQAARGRAPRPIDVEAERVRGVLLGRDLEKARAELKPLREELGRLTASWTNSTDRLMGSDMLSALWSRHGLRLQEQAALTNEAILAPALQQLADRARSTLGPGRYPVLWEVKLQGGFLNMLEALDELSRSDVAAVPVALEMSDTPNQPGKTWKIRLWQ